MLVDLFRLCSKNFYLLTSMLGVPAMTLQRWMLGKNSPPAGARRAVWLTWALLMHPEVIETIYDLATWGRFRTIRPRPRRPPHKSYATVAVPEGVDDWSV